MEYLDGLLEKLTSATGVGYTGDIAEIIIAELKQLDINAEKSQDGSVYAFLPGSENRDVMIACHIDEIGFIVNSIGDNGFVRFSQVGGCDIRILIGQEVAIHGRETVPGYIGAKPPHLMTQEERTKVFPIHELFIDTGMPAAKLTGIVRIGDIITFRGQYRKLQNNLRSAKSLDNRASVAAGILALNELKALRCKANIHFVATSQEEFTGLGAKVFSNKLSINQAVVVDVTFGDQPDLLESECFPLDSGPVIGRGGSISYKLFRMMVDTAKELEMPYQVEPMPTITGTDADIIAFNKQGIPCGVIGIPLRYMHTPAEVVSLKDIERTARLLVSYVKKL